MNGGTEVDGGGWERIAQHAIRRGDFTISHATVRGGHRFVLWQGNDMRGVFGASDDAKRAADVMAHMETK